VSSDLPVDKARALRVQAVFLVADDHQAQDVAARMIDRAHEIANLPECECDVDVTVELARAEPTRGPGDPAGAPVPAGPVKH
jgi:hypothetical protein